MELISSPKKTKVFIGDLMDFKTQYLDSWNDNFNVAFKPYHDTVYIYALTHTDKNHSDEVQVFLKTFS